MCELLDIYESNRVLSYLSEAFSPSFLVGSTLTGGASAPGVAAQEKEDAMTFVPAASIHLDDVHVISFGPVSVWRGAHLTLQTLLSLLVSVHERRTSEMAMIGHVFSGGGLHSPATQAP
jgi:hypothetical protein